jgi:Zn-dependent peptidase ImmA (M78 family)
LEKITAVNSELMRWARETCNMPISSVAEQIDKTPEQIIAWEAGTDHPTYTQLEKLSSLYRKPLAVFFFSNIPQINAPKSSCRSLPEHIYDSLSFKVVRKINDARAMQINLYELNNNVNPAPQLLTNFDFPIDLRKAALELRKVLGVSLKVQKQNRKNDDALEMWRDCFLNYGIYIFKDAFEDDSISGFCLCDPVFPIICLNNSMSFTRQIFTLFHEFYHIISDTSGIDKIEDDYFEFLSQEQLEIEKACNRFAGEFLVPNYDFDEEIRGLKVNEHDIVSLAYKYNVSREVITRKLLERNIITQDEYEQRREEYLDDAIRAKQKKKEEGGGNYYNTLISYLGYGYLHLVYDNYRKHKIDVFQLSDYTRTRIENLPKLEATWGWRVKR